MPSSDGLIQQRGDILLLVAMGCAKDHHTVLRRREAHTVDSLVNLGRCWLFLALSLSQSPTVVAKHPIKNTARERRFILVHGSGLQSVPPGKPRSGHWNG